jgi:zinc transporter 2
MEGAPKGIDFNEVMKILLNIDGVKRVHNLRIWALSLDKIAMSAHVAISNC